MKRALAIIFVLTCLTFAGPVSADDEKEVPDLWVDLSVGAPLIDLFNERAEAEDIARVEHISQLDLLADITAGKKLVVFKSAADAMRLLPHIHEEIDIVGYNLEHGPANPVFEQENPIESIQLLREATDEYGLDLALGPDRRFAQSDGVIMAPYADYFILQVQKVQTEPETVYDFVEPLIADLRAANPDIEISLQIRTEGDVEELLDLLAPLGNDIQGISILTSEDTLSVAEEMMGTLRPDANIAEPAEDEAVKATPKSVVEALTEAKGAKKEESSETAGAETSEAAEPEANNAVLEEVVPAVGKATTVEGIAASGAAEIVTTAETNERTGSTALFIIMALVAGFALGAGYVSHRTGS